MFSRLTHEDKLAFFELLDEYFESRPHLLTRESTSVDGAPLSQPAVVAASAVHRTMASNPQATADLISSGLKSIPKGSQYSAASNPIIANAAGRFAASSIASSYGTKSPPAPPRRNVGGTDDSQSPSRAAPPGGLSGLVSSKRFGDLDTTSVKSAIASSFKGGKPAAAPPSTTLPPALNSRHNFAPPPVRRIPTNTSSDGDMGGTASETRNNKWSGSDPAPVRRVPSHNTLQRQPTPEPELPQGEPAEALYDYTSNASEDINVRQGDRLIIVERTSDDWWTGEINGQRGLLPASYVRIL